MTIAKTILKGTLSNWAGLFIVTIVTILITPYVLSNLGDERYGIYQITFSVIQYLILLELGMRGAVVRFSSKYIHSRDIKSLNGIISTTFFLCLVLGVIALITSFALGLLSTRFFDISGAYRSESLFLFVALGFSIVVSFLGYSFGGILIGHYRYDLQNIHLLINNVGKAVIVVILFSLGWVSLTSWALAMVSASLIGLIYVAFVAFYLEPELGIRLSHVNTHSIKELCGFGLWNMLIQLSGLLILSANAIIIGRVLGPQAVPYYAIPLLLIVRLQSFVGGLTTTLVPHASSTLSTGDKSLMRNLLLKGTYAASMLVFPLGGVLLVMCKSLFSVWLPPEYESSWVIYAVLMIAFFGSITQTTSYYLLLGGGNIKGMSLVYLAAAITAVVLSVIFLGSFGWGIISAAVALVIPRFISTCLFQPWFASRQIGINLWRYINQSYTRPILCSLPSVVLGLALVNLFPPRNLVFWAVEYFVALVPFGVFALTGVLDWPMREKIIGALFRCLSFNKAK